MGTNYYLKEEEKPACECCKRPYVSNILHIGKSSFGWCFSLHVIPIEGINSLDDWKARWSQPDTSIENEYGDRVTPDDMLRKITQRGDPLVLKRHRIGDHCIGHGPGTWDLIPGEFS